MLTPNQRLAELQKSVLERDDETDPGGRIYRHPDTGEVFHSVTRILSATEDESKKKALANWLERPGSGVDRETAARRGTAAHAAAEYLLKTAKRMSSHAANRKQAWKTNEQGLMRPYSAITSWAIGKALAGTPRAPFGVAGYSRGLTNWITENVGAIYGCEFGSYHPGGWAGTCDALIGLKENPGALNICDWKTSASRNPERSRETYSHQCGAYSLGLTSLTGLRADGAIIVLARRSGAPIVWKLDRDELTAAEDAFKRRAVEYFAALFESHSESLAA